MSSFKDRFLSRRAKPQLISRFATFSSPYSSTAAAARSKRRSRRAAPGGMLRLPERIQGQPEPKGKHDAASLAASQTQGEQGSGGAAERRHPTGRERMGSPIWQALQEPILQLPWLSFRVCREPTCSHSWSACALTRETVELRCHSWWIHRTDPNPDPAKQVQHHG